MLIKIGDEIAINIMTINCFKIIENEKKEKTTIVSFNSDSSIRLDDEQTKHFESFMKKILPDISTEEGQNFVISSLQQISQFRKGK